LGNGLQPLGNLTIKGFPLLGIDHEYLGRDDLSLGKTFVLLIVGYTGGMLNQFPRL
jgi:hypothetical protein